MLAEMTHRPLSIASVTVPRICGKAVCRILRFSDGYSAQRTANTSSRRTARSKRGSWTALSAMCARSPPTKTSCVARTAARRSRNRGCALGFLMQTHKHPACGRVPVCRSVRDKPNFVPVHRSGRAMIISLVRPLLDGSLRANFSRLHYVAPCKLT